ncbi:MAG: hypothetical protein R6X29_06815 [Acidimicrobiia bacterium]|jgi:hypothetical protein
MKERFSTTEWSQVLRLPPLMFQFVALADGRMQPEEAAQFAQEVGDARSYNDPLLREVLTDLSTPAQFEASYAESTRITSSGPDAIEREIMGIRTVLGEHLTADEYNRFFFSALGMAKLIADAAGSEPKKKGVFGRAKAAEPEMSEIEAKALFLLMTKFGADLDAGRRALANL